MAEKKPMIVIKKVTVVAGGGHGGSWKVALADFMTALMAFFLVMWLVGQSDQTKKAVSDYFSTPSVIEYNFQNYGVELTLEKLFLDIINEPLKAFQNFMEPVDKTPNLLDMGSTKVVAAYLADQLTDIAKNVSVSQDGFELEIPDNLLFEKGTSKPSKKFIQVMDKLAGVTSGLKDADIQLTSNLFVQAIADESPQTAEMVATERLDLIRNKVAATLEHSSVVVKGYTEVAEKKGEVNPNNLVGALKVKIIQHETNSEGKRSRKLESMFGNPKVNMKLYDDFVDQQVNGKKTVTKNRNVETSKAEAKGKPSGEQKFKNPLEEELQKPDIGLPASSEE